MPLDKNTLKVSSSIIKIIGVFESVNVKKTISGFKSIGYTSDSLDDDTLGFYKNYWYQEFRDLSETEEFKLFERTYFLS